MNNHFHFIGVGGIGMSSIAQLLMKKGNRISGSDVKNSDIILRLQNEGAKISIGHRAENIEKPDFVVYSSAVDSNNVELRAASDRKIPILKRAELLSKLMEGQKAITIAGAHGKTTTASLISFMLNEAGLKPTASIGGLISNFDDNAWMGDGNYFVSEVDESDGTFLLFNPYYSVITNIDFEHVDFYLTWDNIKDAYRKYILKTQPQGCVFAYGDDKVLIEILNSTEVRYMSFGLSNNCSVHPINISSQDLSSRYSLVYMKKDFGEITINLPGRHNIANSLAAVSLGIYLGIDFSKIQRAINNYKGVRRRFQIKGIVNDITIVDDYGHHPTEIKATLDAARSIGKKRIVVVFQPHRYTRTKYLFDEFVKSLSFCDYLIITDIYAASEPAIPEVRSELLCEKIKESGKSNVFYYPKEEILDNLIKIIKPGDLVLTLGAGDITRISDELVKKLS